MRFSSGLSEIVLASAQPPSPQPPPTCGGRQSVSKTRLRRFAGVHSCAMTSTSGHVTSIGSASSEGAVCPDV